MAFEEVGQPYENRENTMGRKKNREKMRMRVGGMQWQARGHRRLLASHQKLKEVRTGCPLHISEGAGPCQLLGFGLLGSGTMRESIVVLSAQFAARGSCTVHSSVAGDREGPLADSDGVVRHRTSLHRTELGPSARRMAWDLRA